MAFTYKEASTIYSPMLWRAQYCARALTISSVSGDLPMGKFGQGMAASRSPPSFSHTASAKPPPYYFRQWQKRPRPIRPLMNIDFRGFSPP